MNDFNLNFNNNDLSAIPNVVLSRRFASDLPTVDIKSYKLVRRDGEVVTGRAYGNKLIKVEGYILSDSRAEYEIAKDALNYALNGIERPLILVQGESTRRYTATVEAFTCDHIERGRAYIEIVFRCSRPFGADTETTSYSESITEATKNIDIEFGGTANCNPVIEVVLSSLTGGANKNVGISNYATGQGITVNRTWTAGDIMVIDTAIKKVTVNGSIVDFIGVFPYFLPKTSTLLYSDNLSARSSTVNVRYVKQYL